ncbi:MAG: ABC transporter permease [Actinomycetes bacterium]
MSQVREYVERRELLTNLVLRELRSRYKRSTLGWTWSLLNPLSSVLIYWAVFGVFLKVDPPVGDPSGQDNFVLFLLCALIPWNFFSNGVMQSIESLVVNAGLIRKVYFPRELLVASTVGGLLVTFLIELGVVIAILLVAGNMVLPWIPVIVVLVALQTVMVLGIGLLLSAANVYFRDVRHFVTLIMPVLFYSTPIVYPITTVPETWKVAGRSIPLREIYGYNPLVRLVTAYRDAMYSLRMPAWDTLAYIAIWAIGLLLLGQWVFNRLDHRLAEEV